MTKPSGNVELNMVRYSEIPVVFHEFLFYEHSVVPSTIEFCSTKNGFNRD